MESIKPYVVSEDIMLQLTKWSQKNSFTVPKMDYFQCLKKESEQELKKIFLKVEVVPDLELINFLDGLVKKQNRIVSLDRTYINIDNPRIVGFLDTSRAVNDNLEDLGLISRDNFQPLSVQFDNLSKKLIQQGIRDVTLLDDVIFGGTSLAKIIEFLNIRGINVTNAISAIGIEEGIKKVESLGVPVEVGIVYREVIDEICQRDFYPGIPQSGRTLISKDTGVFGASYILPFGKPFDWASIPKESEKNFSEFFLTQTVLLWGRIEKLSNKTITLKDLPRKLQVFGFPETVSVTKVLRNI